MSRFIDVHRDRFGVEPICRVLQIAPSSYYAARTQSPSRRDLADARLGVQIERIHAANFGVYGVRKVWRQLGREGVEAGRDRVARVMNRLGLHGIRRERSVRTTRAARTITAGDLVNRSFSASAPDRLWVADITYVRLTRGFCYTAFVSDAFSRRIVG